MPCNSLKKSEEKQISGPVKVAVTGCSAYKIFKKVKPRDFSPSKGNYPKERASNSTIVFNLKMDTRGNGSNRIMLQPPMSPQPHDFSEVQNHMLLRMQDPGPPTSASEFPPTLEGDNHSPFGWTQTRSTWNPKMPPYEHLLDVEHQAHQEQ